MSVIDINIPASFQELRNSTSSFQVTESNDIKELNPTEITEKIESISEALSLDSDADGQNWIPQEVLNDIFSILDGYAQLSVEHKVAFAQRITELANKALDLITSAVCLPVSTKNTVKAILYFVQIFAVQGETAALQDDGEESGVTKSKGSSKPSAASKKGKAKSANKDGDNDLSWPLWRASCLELLQRVCNLDPSKLWSMGIVPDNFLAGIWGYALSLLEKRPVGFTTATDLSSSRSVCIGIVVDCVRLFGGVGGSLVALTTALYECLAGKDEHMCAVVAEVCVRADGALASALMHAIGETRTEAKNIGNFIETLAKTSPEKMSAFFPIIKAQIDSTFPALRSSMLTAMSLIVAHAHSICVAAGTAPADCDAEASNGGDADEVQEDNGDESDANDPLDRAQALRRGKSRGYGEEDDDGDFIQTRNVAQLVRVRDALLDLIVERTHDKNHYTRGTVLKSWIGLLEAGAVPVRRIGSVAEIAVDRLRDKTAHVRKNALSLLVSLLDNNPFGSRLDGAEYGARKIQLEAELLARIRVLFVVAKEAEDAEAGLLPEPDSQSPSPSDDELEDFAQCPEVREDSDVGALQRRLEFVTDALSLIETVVKGLPIIETMLLSKTVSDVQEALKFFSRAAKFGVQGSGKSLQKAFSLIWHQDPVVKQECVNTFSGVYLTDGAVLCERTPLPANEMAANLVQLCMRCEEAEHASLEQIIGELFVSSTTTGNNNKTKGVFANMDKDVIEALWLKIQRLFVSESSSIAAEGDRKSSECSASFRVIAMIAKVCPDVLTAQKLQLINTTAFSLKVFTTRDFETIKTASQCLQAAPSVYSSQGSAKETKERMAAYASAAPALSAVILGAMCADSEELTRSWFAACEEAMHALYHIHPTPDKVMGSVIIRMYKSFSANNGLDDNKAAKAMSRPARLARLLFVLGQCALCTLVYTERLSALAKRTNETKTKEQKEKEAVARSKIKNENEDSLEAYGSEAMEEEMGLAAAVDSDHELTYNAIVERELVIENMLGKFHPLIAFVVANEKKSFSHPLIRETALSALTRYMSVSHSICERYLPLLFTVLNSTVSVSEGGQEVYICSPEVRTSVIIALGDLSFRFPNAVEPWTARMYSRLADDDITVRYNTLTVLTHLVLNDMIKVKGQVSHVVMCLVDSCSRVRDLASMLFTRLSERSNNPVYNLLGDIIAILSRDNGNINVDSTSEDGTSAAVQVASLDAMEADMYLPKRVLSQHEFETVMHFLLSFVKNSKQADALLERLLIRLGLAQTVRQRVNLSFCISELTVSEKGVKKMVELFRHIKDALHHEEVFDNIQTVCERAKKSKSTAAAGDEVTGVEPAQVPAQGGTSQGGDLTALKSAVEELLALLVDFKREASGEVGPKVEGDGALSDEQEGGTTAPESEILAPSAILKRTPGGSAKARGVDAKAHPVAADAVKKQRIEAQKTKKARATKSRSTSKAWSDEDESDDDEEVYEEEENERRVANVKVEGSKSRSQVSNRANVVKSKTASRAVTISRRRNIVDESEEEDN